VYGDTISIILPAASRKLERQGCDHKIVSSSSKVELGVITNHSGIHVGNPVDISMEGKIPIKPFCIRLTWCPAFPECDGANAAEKYLVAIFIFHIQSIGFQ